MIIKSISSQVADLDQKEGIVKHVWSRLGNVDADEDIIMPGAYNRTIAERGPDGANRIKFLWQHDWSNPVGVPLEMAEVKNELVVVTKVAPTTLGKDLLIMYEAGVITEHSIGADVLRRDEEDFRHILELRLWEGSAVTWGANPLTPFMEMKSERRLSYVTALEQAINTDGLSAKARAVLTELKTTLTPAHGYRSPPHQHGDTPDVETWKGVAAALSSLKNKLTNA